MIVTPEKGVESGRFFGESGPDSTSRGCWLIPSFSPWLSKVCLNGTRLSLIASSKQSRLSSTISTAHRAVATGGANAGRNYGRKRPLAGRPDRRSRTRRAADESAVAQRSDSLALVSIAVASTTYTGRFYGGSIPPVGVGIVLKTTAATRTKLCLN